MNTSLQWNPKGSVSLSPEERVAWGEAIQENVKKIRVGLGMFHQDVANLVGKTRTWVGQIETGRMLPSRLMIPILAAALETTPQEMIVRGSHYKVLERTRSKSRPIAPESQVTMPRFIFEPEPSPLLGKSYVSGGVKGTQDPVPQIPQAPKPVPLPPRPTPKSMGSRATEPPKPKSAMGPYLWQEKVTKGTDGIVKVPILTPDSQDGEVHLDLEDTKHLGAMLLDQVGLIPSTQAAMDALSKSLENAIGRWANTAKGKKMLKDVRDALEEVIAEKHSLLYARTALISKLELKIQELENRKGGGAELKEELAEMREKVRTLTQITQESETTHQRQLDELNRKSKETAESWKKARAREIDAANAEWQKKINLARASSTELSPQVKTRLDAVARQLEDSAKAVQEGTKIAETWKKTADERGAKLEVMAVQLNRLEADSSALHQQVEDLSETLTRVRGENRTLEAENQVLRQEVRDLQDEDRPDRPGTSDAKLDEILAILNRNSEHSAEKALEDLLESMEALLEDEELPGLKWRLRLNEIVQKTLLSLTDGDDGDEKPFIPQQGR